MPSAVVPLRLDLSNNVRAFTTFHNTSTSSQITRRKIVCFSDFDGTIFMQDTGHVLFDTHGCGPAHREVLDQQIKSGERSFKEVSDELWGSLNVPFNDGFEVMKTALEIDPGFKAFHKFCLAHNIPFNVISAGLKPILRRVLDQWLGEEESSHIHILANDADINTPGTVWKPIWLHSSDLGHDKALSITQARSSFTIASPLAGTIPLIVFIGDGVSDLPAAQHADVLFARRGLRLEEYCVENGISYIPYDTFGDIQMALENIMEEDERKTGGMGWPARRVEGADVWRCLSARSGKSMPFGMTPGVAERMGFSPQVQDGFLRLTASPRL